MGERESFLIILRAHLSFKTATFYFDSIEEAAGSIRELRKDLSIPE